MKVITIVGARPQFIKAATVSRAFAQHGVDEIIVHTGQHFDANMSDVFFDELEIPRPHHHLGIGGGPHGAMTGRQLEKIEVVLREEKPDWVLVYGDTNSTLAGALAAAKLHIPVAHVEAGLRSFNRRMPEEINRVLTDHMSTQLFAPTTTAMQNLTNEGITGDGVRLVGDVMYDATLFYKSRARKPAWFEGLGISEQEFVLCTIHRAENTDDQTKLRGILQGLGDSELHVVLPLHPRTRGVLKAQCIDVPANVHVVAPVGYLEMTWLEMHCHVVATDSGGVQKEAYFHGKPCVTLRNETEWVELLEIGANRLVGASATKISRAITGSFSVLQSSGVYGNGAASTEIAKILSNSP
ncbi:MAG: UDP-N-acetylglucosamine 2-epimerase (non-hydrolyzing) [Rubrivivax sp.]|nr:MAG: UDP-N-acetylglucosamine 2-epimerase (non-hydrolyzing) [Rubrivivax sp.]